MSAIPSHLTRKPARSSSRHGSTSQPAVPLSPHTPQRGILSEVNSPGTFRTEEDPIIFEIGSRHLSAGFVGDSQPRCRLGFGPDSARRAGDHRKWQPGYNERVRKRQRTEDWARDYELWGMDLRDVDLGLVEDKLERAFREAWDDYLLMDARSRKVILVLPSVLPQALIATILRLLFSNFQVPSISMLNEPTMTVLAAGLRSGVIVDIGWHETIVSTVYEYREVSQHRSVRAMKKVSQLLAKDLEAVLPLEAQSHGNSEAPDADYLTLEPDYIEEVISRVGWCSPFPSGKSGVESLEGKLDGLQIGQDRDKGKQRMPEKSIEIPFPLSSTQRFAIPNFGLSRPIETTFFEADVAAYELDDHEQTLPQLLHRALTLLSPDVRGTCMSRIIITGGGSQIPGLKIRLIAELSSTLQSRSWSMITGKAIDGRRQKSKKIDNGQRAQTSREQPVQDRAGEEGDASAPSTVPAAFQPQEPDRIGTALHIRASRGIKPTTQGTIRGVDSLGAWVGASLVSSLKVKGIVEVERDIYLHSGLAGAKRETESAASDKQRAATNYAKGGGDRSSWTLASFA